MIMIIIIIILIIIIIIIITIVNDDGGGGGSGGAYNNGEHRTRTANFTLTKLLNNIEGEGGAACHALLGNICCRCRSKRAPNTLEQKHWSKNIGALRVTCALT